MSEITPYTNFNPQKDPINTSSDAIVSKDLNLKVDQKKNLISNASATRTITNSSATPPLPESIKKLCYKNTKVKEYLILTYSPALPQPGNSSTHQNKVILWRGCRPDQLVSMVKYGSAGGVKANTNAKPPEEFEAVAQVGEQKSLPEFTFDTRIAEQFGRRNFVVACEIAVKYLAEGSVIEKGLVCLPEAPVKVIGWKFGQFFS